MTMCVCVNCGVRGRGCARHPSVVGLQLAEDGLDENLEAVGVSALGPELDVTGSTLGEEKDGGERVQG